MNLSHIRALLFLDTQIMLGSYWRLAEYFFTPLSTIIIWGIFSLVPGTGRTGGMILAVTVVWTYLYVIQSAVNLLVNEDRWSGAFRQIMASGVRLQEYMFARSVFACLTGLAVFIAMGCVAYLFGLPILTNPGMWAVAGIGMLSAIALALVVAGVVFFAGREYSFLGWTITQVVVMFSAPYFSADILPLPLQTLASVMPFTSLFAATRIVASGESIPYGLFVNSLLVGIAFLLFGCTWCALAYRRATRNGRLARDF